jgi:hypothetical protein
VRRREAEQVAERVADLVAWARSRIVHCRQQEAKFGSGDVAIEASVERRALQAVLAMLEES